MLLYSVSTTTGDLSQEALRVHAAILTAPCTVLSVWGPHESMKSNNSKSLKIRGD